MSATLILKWKLHDQYFVSLLNLMSAFEGKVFLPDLDLFTFYFFYSSLHNISHQKILGVLRYFYINIQYKFSRLHDVFNAVAGYISVE